MRFVKLPPQIPQITQNRDPGTTNNWGPERTAMASKRPREEEEEDDEEEEEEEEVVEDPVESRRRRRRRRDASEALWMGAEVGTGEGWPRAVGLRPKWPEHTGRKGVDTKTFLRTIRTDHPSLGSGTFASVFSCGGSRERHTAPNLGHAAKVVFVTGTIQHTLATAVRELVLAAPVISDVTHDVAVSASAVFALWMRRGSARTASLLDVLGKNGWVGFGDAAGGTRMLGDMVSQMRYLHSLGIVNADIKPGNVLIYPPPSSTSAPTSAPTPASTSGSNWALAWVTDFGAALFGSTGEVGTREIGTHITRSPALAEPSAEIPVDVLDIHSLAATWLSLAAGKTAAPHSGGNIVDDALYCADYRVLSGKLNFDARRIAAAINRGVLAAMSCGDPNGYVTLDGALLAVLTYGICLDAMACGYAVADVLARMLCAGTTIRDTDMGRDSVFFYTIDDVMFALAAAEVPVDVAAGYEGVGF